ncbi:MAG TPA: hypothetical protein VFB58_06275 [Chloroflexota bacterium]|nr:hypothetical protein [Chloroflexota bacterium]
MRRLILALVLAVAVPALPSVTSADSPAADTYTGTWQSSAHYHFDVPYCTGVDLDVTIQGTMTLVVDSHGQATGSVSGTVGAPVTDCGGQDVSSGTGSISGTLTGRLDSSLTLSAPVIDMHWGTYVGGGYTVEQFITMPDYTFSAAGYDCVSASGTIAEQGFPTEQIVDDGQGHMMSAPGTGTADGQWSVHGASAAAYSAQSAQVDQFIAQSNALLAAPLSFARAQSAILAPLSALQNSVGACLQTRLTTWRTHAASNLLASLPTGSSPAEARQAGDAVRLSDALDPSVTAQGTIVATRDGAAIDAALTAGDWSKAALMAREILLLEGESETTVLQGRLDAGLASRLSATTAGSLRKTARAAYTFGDSADARAAVQRLVTITPHPSRKRSFSAVLHAGIASIQLSSSGDTVTWKSVSGAVRYVAVALSGGAPAYVWSGSALSVTFGDTSLDGVTGSAEDGWTIAAPAHLTWHVLALGVRGQIVGIG